MSNARRPPGDKSLDRYAKLVTLASDDAAAPQERATAARKIREMEEADPRIRVRYAARLAEEARANSAQHSNATHSAHGAHNAHSAPPNAANTPASLEAFLRAQGVQLFQHVREQFAYRAQALAQSSVEQLTAGVVQSVEQVLSELEALMNLLSDTTPYGDDINLGTLDWKRAVTTSDHVKNAYARLAEPVDEVDVEEGDDPQYGDLAVLPVSLPLGLLLRCGEDPKLALALVHALIGELVDEDDDEGEEDDASDVASVFG